MKTNPDLEREDTLLEVMLRDEDWNVANAALKAEALRTFHATRRVRLVRRWVGPLMILTLLVATAVYWSDPPASPSPPTAAVVAPANLAPAGPRALTDQELVAAFPKGSCFIAEVDGKKQLVFMDPQLANVYMARSRDAGK